MKAPTLPRPERSRAHAHLVETVAGLSAENHHLARENQRLLHLLEGCVLLFDSLAVAESVPASDPAIRGRVDQLRKLVSDLRALV
jgi:hypothetical protein